MTESVRTSRFLELRALASIQHMRFSTRHRIEGTRSGRHISRQLGGGGEFADFREYTPGEDLRRLDWRVMSRTGRAYIKVFQDETNLVCMPVIDISGSMQFCGHPDSDGTGKKASGSKLEYAQYFVTALSHIICFGRDQVGLGLVSDKLLEFFPPASTSDHLTRLHDAIERLVPSGSTELAGSLEQLFQRVGRRGVLLLVSDFLADDLEAVFARMRLFRHRGWDVVAFHLVHPQEERLPAGTAFRFEGLESDGAINCSPAEIRELYERNFAAHLALVRKLSLSAGCDYLLVSTAVPYLHTLNRFLVDRTG